MSYGVPFLADWGVLFYRKDLLDQAGLQVPKTWKELIATAEKLKAAGQDCVYTSGWPSWVHIENFSAWHNVPIGTKQNGMGGIAEGSMSPETFERLAPAFPREACFASLHC